MDVMYVKKYSYLFFYLFGYLLSLFPDNQSDWIIATSCFFSK